MTSELSEKRRLLTIHSITVLYALQEQVKVKAAVAAIMPTRHGMRTSNVNRQISYLNTLTGSRAGAWLSKFTVPCVVLVADSVGFVAL